VPPQVSDVWEFATRPETDLTTSGLVSLGTRKPPETLPKTLIALADGAWIHNEQVVDLKQKVAKADAFRRKMHNELQVSSPSLSFFGALS